MGRTKRQERGFWRPYRDCTREASSKVGFGAAGGEAVLPAELQQFPPLHRRELHPPAPCRNHPPAGEARVQLSLESPPLDRRILVGERRASVGGIRNRRRRGGTQWFDGHGAARRLGSRAVRHWLTDGDQIPVVVVGPKRRLALEGGLN